MEQHIGTFACTRCGLIGQWNVDAVKANKLPNPNCPTCHKQMEPFRVAAVAEGKPASA